MDAGNILKPALARGELRAIGATTLDEYRKYIEKDAALERRFQQVFVGEPSVEDTVAILRGIAPKYEAHHKVTISDGALVAAATLSNRYITGRQLPDKAIDLMDEASRPALFVCGESLGAFASQSVFSSVEDALTQVDGALWVGTPAFTPMHEALTAARHTGSPEVAPVVNNGRRVRFVNEPSDLRTDLYGRELGPWGFPRIVYAQHPSDPVVWWNNKLIWTQPDWLRERAGRDVSMNVEFTRFATYIQVLADLPVAGTAPGGEDFVAYGVKGHAHGAAARARGGLAQIHR